MNNTNLASEFSYGIIPFMTSSTSLLYLLIQHRRGHWGFPKGHAENNETAAIAACREFTEETGITEFKFHFKPVFTEQYLNTKRGQKFLKTVTYFFAEVFTKTLRIQEDEVINYNWADYESALGLLTFKESQMVLTKAHHYLLNNSLN